LYICCIFENLSALGGHLDGKVPFSLSVSPFFAYELVVVLRG
jgi:hypothetical protein